MIREILLGISRGLAVGIFGLIAFLHVSAGKYFTPVIKYFEPVALAAYLVCLAVWILTSQEEGEQIWTG
jgi:formate/nitrite transporter FocA (FNT family)